MGNWKTPKQVLVGRKLTVGEILVPSELGIEDHPQYGALPTLTVTAVKDDGSLLAGTAVCAACPEEIEVHAGDWFQKRRCEKCQKRHARHQANPPQSAEAKAAKEAERIATKAAKDAAKAEAKAKREADREAARVAKAEKKAAELKAKAEEKLAKAAGVATAVEATK